MIKCNVTINGIVSRTASMRTNKEGKSYIGFAVKTTIPAKAGGCKQVEIFVSKDGTDAELPSYDIHCVSFVFVFRSKFLIPHSSLPSHSSRPSLFFTHRRSQRLCHFGIVTNQHHAQ